MTEEEEELRIEWEVPPQESANIEVPVVVILLVGLLMVYTFASVATYAVMRHQQAGINAGGGTLPPALGRADLNFIHAAPFVLDTRAYALEAEARRQLHGYGWVDADAGVVHLPIDLAMSQVLAADGGL